jgi:hypothetical protein
MRRSEVLESTMTDQTRGKRAGTRTSAIALVFLVIGVFSPPAHAYLDPSTGSMIVTAIVGLIASIGLAIRTYWYRLKSFFKGGKKDSTEVKDSTEGEASSTASREPTD